MEKYAWKANIKEGSLEEYKRRHDAIWDEMKEVLKSAGIKNYECEYGAEYAARVQSESEVVKKWDEYMKDILIMVPDPETGAQPKLAKVFELD